LNTTSYTVKELVREYGPFKPIVRARERQLLEEGRGAYVFALMSTDAPYEDIPEEERPTDEELVERGETKEDYSASVLYGAVGHHLVNVDELFESAKPMPMDLAIEGNDNLWFGDDGLPNP